MNHKNYRWFLTKSGKLVIGGKSAAQNDELLKELTKKKENHLVMHTELPGSPFSIILAPIEEITKEDKKETAIFTACFSRAWRSRAKKAEVHEFTLGQLYKTKSMKTGTWGVSQPIKSHTVKPLELVLTFQDNTLRAIPTITTNQNLLKIKPGTIDKTKKAHSILEKLPQDERITKESLLTALPAGGVTISRT